LADQQFYFADQFVVGIDAVDQSHDARVDALDVDPDHAPAFSRQSSSWRVAFREWQITLETGKDWARSWTPALKNWQPHDPTGLQPAGGPNRGPPRKAENRNPVANAFERLDGALGLLG
jgi:hypothetical protein